MKQEVKSSQMQGPTSLATVKFLGRHEILEVLVVGPDFHQMGRAVTLLENFLWKCNMRYTLYPWISLLESTLETSYKPQT